MLARLLLCPLRQDRRRLHDSDNSSENYVYIPCKCTPKDTHRTAVHVQQCPCSPTELHSQQGQHYPRRPDAISDSQSDANERGLGCCDTNRIPVHVPGGLPPTTRNGGCKSTPAFSSLHFAVLPPRPTFLSLEQPGGGNNLPHYPDVDSRPAEEALSPPAPHGPPLSMRGCGAGAHAKLRM